MCQEEKDRLQRVGIYITCLGIANQMLIGYRSLFLITETLFLAFGVSLLTVGRVQYIWIGTSIGLVFCFVFFFLSSWGRKRVDYWRDRIFEEIRGTDLEKIFEIYQPAYIWRIPSLVSPRFWLDLISPIMMGIIWILIVYLSILL